MAGYRLPTVEQIQGLASEDLAAILDHLFEPSVPLHSLCVPLLRDKAFTSYDELAAGVGAQLLALSDSTSSSDTRWLESILSAHPRLGEKKITSAQSSVEQAQLQGSQPETEQLVALNAEYEKAFPGLRYVVFVNGRDRPIIMDDMRSRITRGDLVQERRDAIEAMCQIAVDRARKAEVEV